jgi:hypothetical protein
MPGHFPTRTNSSTKSPERLGTNPATAAECANRELVIIRRADIVQARCHLKIDASRPVGQVPLAVIPASSLPRCGPGT